MALDNTTDKDLGEKYYEIFSENKRNIILVILFLLVIYFGAIFYKESNKESMLIASDLYQKVQIAENLNEVEGIVKKLKNDYKETAYASRASIFLGNLYMKDKKYEDAISNYIWSSNHAKETAIKSLSHYQLALNYFLIGDYNSAMKESLEIDEQGFKGLKYYLKGDIHVKLNQTNEAIKCFEQAYDFYRDKNDLARVIKTKIDAIGPN